MAQQRQPYPKNDAYSQLDECIQHSDHSDNKCDPTQHEDEECSTAQRAEEEERGPQHHNDDEYNTTTTIRRRTVRPKPTDKEVEEERGPTQHTSPMPTLRDPTMIGVSPSTRRVGKVEGVEWKGVETGGGQMQPTQRWKKGGAMPFGFIYLFSYITCT